jgi:hypothetical protein
VSVSLQDPARAARAPVPPEQAARLSDAAHRLRVRLELACRRLLALRSRPPRWLTEQLVTAADEAERLRQELAR